MNIEEAVTLAKEQGRQEGLKEAYKLIDEFMSVTRFKHHEMTTAHDRTDTAYKVRITTLDTIKILLEEKIVD